MLLAILPANGRGRERSGTASFQATAGPVKRRNIAFVGGGVRRQNQEGARAAATAADLLREMQLQRANAGGGIQPDLALDRERLQRYRTIRAADQRIGADAGAYGRLRLRSGIST